MQRLSDKNIVMLLLGIIFNMCSVGNAYAQVAVSQNEKNYPWFAIGLIAGSLITLSAALYFTRHFRNRYMLMQNRVKQAIKEVEASEHAFKGLEKEQQESQDLLEERVQERTLELNIALQELESVNQELERINVLDELTGLHNRRFYDQKIQAEFRRSRRNLTPLSLVVIDIDHFKSVNDLHGHLVGDQCLIWVSEHIKQSLKRSTDKAFRYGGEEFCLILADTDAKGALQLAERLRTSINQQNFSYQDVEISLTISCGICTYLQEKDVSPETMFSGADKALYQAKHNGRNQSLQHVFSD
jgi:diguanylate cyclase (GGDEF)-like protein